MRSTSLPLLAALALVVAAAPAARAAEAPLPPPPRQAEGARLGLRLEVGAPEGATVALLLRPTPAFRLWAGPSWNVVGWGLQGGIALVPWQLAVAPVLSAELGHYFDADLTPFVNTSSGAPAEVEPLLRSVGYTYAAAHLGVEIGSQRGLAFTVQGGLAYIVGRSGGSAGTTQGAGGTTTRITFRDPRLRATAPSVKLGLQYFF